MDRSNSDATSGDSSMRSSAKEHSFVTGEDIEFALRAAEGLAAEADLAERQDRIARVWVGMATVVILSASALTAGLLSGHVGTVGFRVFVSIATFILLGGLSAGWWWILGTHSRGRSSYLRLSLAVDIVGIVREVMLEVAERERWSYVRLQATKLRVSAFPPANPVSGERRKKIL
jgi:hypothetical protein